MYKKILVLVLFTVGLFFVQMKPINALGVDVIQSFANSEDEECDTLFGDPADEESVAYFLQEIFNLIKYAGPLLCLALSIVEFVKATASQDKDALMKAMKTTGKRIILAFALFFIPVLINFFFHLLGWYGTCGIS